MAPFLVLVVITALARLVGWGGLSTLNDWPAAATVGLFAMFSLTASAHFRQPRRDRLVAMVPPRTGHAHELVTITGGLEALGAVGLLVPATRVAAAICLGLLLVVMFPANVYAARVGAVATPSSYIPLVRRSLLQAVFVTACVVVAAAG